MLSRRLLAPVLSALCLLAAPAFATAADELVWRGDHATARAIMGDLSKEYAREKKGKITLQPFSTISGLDAVAQGSADIAGSARGKYASRNEEASLNFIPVALDAVVPITHPRNPVGGVTLKQIYEIYFGRLTNWKQLGGEDKPINVYSIAAPLDGVEFSLREVVFKNGDKRVAAPRQYLNTAKLEEAITLDPAGIGLSTLASVHDNPGVKMLAVEGVGASTATVADGTYPLYITLYLAERENSPKRDAVERFVAFLDTPPAKDILRRHQLIPYGEVGDLAPRNEQRLAFVDAALRRDVTELAAAPTPIAAPHATLEARTRIAPGAESTQQARDNLARAEAKKAAEKAAAKPAPKAVASAPAKAGPAKPKVAAAPAKPATKKPAATAQANKTDKKPAASFGNVSSGAGNGG
ncbi:MAG: peptidoglycan-binding protein [Rhodanobacteraceae bacterium]|jgi:phosphate transport system substrate-binding protein|nr:peptidoglycan-binding protein [Rhodanobacteraceae bacterium]